MIVNDSARRGDRVVREVKVLKQNDLTPDTMVWTVPRTTVSDRVRGSFMVPCTLPTGRGPSLGFSGALASAMSMSGFFGRNPYRYPTRGVGRSRLGLCQETLGGVTSPFHCNPAAFRFEVGFRICSWQVERRKLHNATLRPIKE